MDKQQVVKIWNDVVTETSNRSKGAFKRALWYGNNNMILGQHKGIRKGIRNAPRILATDLLGLVPLPLGVSAVVSQSVDVVLDRGKDLYSGHIKPLIFNNPISAEEALRKNIKKSIKELDSNAFKVIDRNMVKLSNAKSKVGPAIQALMLSVQSPNVTEENVKKAHEALRTIAETDYYVDKIMGLVVALKDALGKIEKDLNELKKATQKTRQEVMDYIEQVIE